MRNTRKTEPASRGGSRCFSVVWRRASRPSAFLKQHPAAGARFWHPACIQLAPEHAGRFGKSGTILRVTTFFSPSRVPQSVAANFGVHRPAQQVYGRRQVELLHDLNRMDIAPRAPSPRRDCHLGRQELPGQVKFSAIFFVVSCDAPYYSSSNLSYIGTRIALGASRWWAVRLNRQ